MVDEGEGQVEIPVALTRHRSGEVGAHRLHLEAGFAEVLADHLSHARPRLAEGQREEAHGLPLVAGFGQQLLRLGDVVRILPGLRRVERFGAVERPG